jgi:hypothetical protein
MTRRASLPGADELFKNNAPSLSAVREVQREEPTTTSVPSTVGTSAPKSKKGVRSIARRRVTSNDKSPSGR